MSSEKLYPISMHDYGIDILGPVARRLLIPNRWTDKFPAWKEFAFELDELLRFAESQGRLDHFVSRLTCRNTQRDEALDELRVAYFLSKSGFSITQWEPPGLDQRTGEYAISAPDCPRIFVEVKSPGWEGQLSDEERQAGRTKQPKYMDGDGGAFGNWQPLQQCIASPKTYPKFSPNEPNLLVVADDLQVSLHDSVDHVEVALYANHDLYGTRGFFTSAQYPNLGGVGIFRAAIFGSRGVEYQFAVFENPFALPAVKLPASLISFAPPRKPRGLAVRI